MSTVSTVTPQATEQVTSLAKPNALVQIQIIDTTTMAAYLEMMSFIDKFNQMASFGFQANLNFSCADGRISVQFCADLGCLDPYPTESYQKQTRDKPSKVRRRQRRAESRKENIANLQSLEAESDANLELLGTAMDASLIIDFGEPSPERSPDDIIASLPPSKIISEDDAKIDYFLLPQYTTTTKTADTTSVTTAPTSTTIASTACCPCCSTPHSRGRNCPGSDVFQTTYRRCCFHK